MADVRFVTRLAEGVVVLLYDGDQALWSSGKMRKVGRCAVTGKTLPVGSLAYRPVGNQMYRMQRIAPDVIEAAETK